MTVTMRISVLISHLKPSQSVLILLVTQAAPINSAFSLIKIMTVKSAGKPVYEGDNIHKVIFTKNVLDYSDDYARIVGKSQFWYLDTDATTITDHNEIRSDMLLIFNMVWP